MKTLLTLLWALCVINASAQIDVIRPGVTRQQVTNTVLALTTAGGISIATADIIADGRSRTNIENRLAALAVNTITITNAAAIGTTVPVTPLHVKGIASIEAGGIEGTLADAMYFKSIDYPTAQQSRIRVSNSATPAKGLLVFETGIETVGVYNTNQLALNSSGNVGIGTNTPQARLHVSGGSAIIDGKLGIGTTPLNKLDVAGEVVIGSTAAGSVTAPANAIYVQGGVASGASGGAAPTGITFPASTVNWTNTVGVNIELYLDNIGVTGTAITKNGTQILGGLITGYSMLLGPGDYFSETYSAGTPTAKYSKF